MRKPAIGKPKSPPPGQSLSRKLPPLKLPLSAPEANGGRGPRPHPQVNRPGRALFASISTLAKKLSSR